MSSLDRSRTLADADAPPAVLASSGAGRIQRCPCCERLEIQFGNVVFELAPSDLPALAEALVRMSNQPKDRRSKRPYLLRVSEEAPIVVAFSERERAELAWLVARALFAGSTHGLSQTSHSA